MTKAAKNPEEPTTLVGLLRNVSEIKEIIPSTTPKGKTTGIVYYVELLMDNGRTYRHSSFTKPYLENLKEFVDKEITGKVTNRGEFESIDITDLPPNYTEKYPREAAKVVPPKPYTQDQYWKDRFAREGETNAAIEQQFYMARACEFFLALGRMTDANSEDMLDRALAFGMEKYKQYGRTHKDG